MRTNHPRPRPARSVTEPAGLLARARVALFLERLWPASWPALSVTGAFLALALFNVLPLLPGWLHLAVLAGFAAALAAVLWRGFRGFAWPDEAAARRRLEHDSGLPHRPLHALRDRVSGTDPMAAALWTLHQERVRAAVRRLRVRLPQPDIAAHDRYALRVLVGLVLLVAAAGTWGDWRPRVLAALSPAFDGPAQAATATLDLWIAPPEHTGLPPVFLKTGATTEAEPAAPVRVPHGSSVLARVTASGAPELEANGRRVAFETVDPTTHQIQQPLTSGPRVAVLLGGRELGAWPVEVIPDNPPSIAFVSDPAAGERGALRLDYAAQDDYGLAKVTATVALDAAEVDPGLDRTPVELPLALPGARPKEARSTAFHDLTAHPWAGLPVTLRLTATDGAGQTGSTNDHAMLLPERSFSHPVARAIVAERRKLTLRPSEARTEVARALSELSSRPGTYNGDIVVFLALRSAVARLLLDDTIQSIPPIQQLLWETALRIEDGGLSLAERDLRDAERRLADALERGADDQELRRLMDELQTALDRFLDAMQEQLRQALERGEAIPQIPPELAQQMEMLDRNDLQRMMDQMRAMAETGSRDAARQMLSQLQQMLENLRSGGMAQMQQNQQNQALEMMRELQELTKRQQQLLDETFRQSQDAMNGMPGPSQPGQTPRGRSQQGRSGSPLMQQQAEQQEALRRQLGDVMRRLGDATGEIPRPLGRAERAMRDAAQALQRGQPGSAVPPQTQALDELQQGLQAMTEQMMQQMQMMLGMQPGGEPGQPNGRTPGAGRDPLGRRPPGMGQVDNGDVKIPQEADLQRAREILDELRRRSGERNRPTLERDYIDRLLRQF